MIHLDLFLFVYITSPHLTDRLLWNSLSMFMFSSDGNEPKPFSLMRLWERGKSSACCLFRHFYYAGCNEHCSHWGPQAGLWMFNLHKLISIKLLRLRNEAHEMKWRLKVQQKIPPTRVNQTKWIATNMPCVFWLASGRTWKRERRILSSHPSTETSLPGMTQTQLLMLSSPLLR